MVRVFIDENYGGAGLGFFEFCLITGELWALDTGISTVILSITFGAELIVLFGSEEQKNLILLKLISGRRNEWGDLLDHIWII